MDNRRQGNPLFGRAMPDSLAPKPRRSRLQFSLRLLLLAFTAFAIGFPIWYRWPYREEEIRYYQKNGQPDPSRINARIVATWQRQWGGGKKQHGPCWVWRESGDVRTIDHYRNGVRNGPFLLQSDGYDIAGQFVDGEKDGEWLTTHSGKVLRRETFDRGVLHGLLFETSDNGRSYEFRVANGQLDWTDARSQTHPLFRKLTACQVDNPRIADALRTPYLKWATQQLIADETLENPVGSLAQVLNVPIVIDDRIALPTRPQPASMHDLDASAFLLQTVQLHGAALDYRYGFIWVTTPQDAQDWHDPTGIAEIRLPKDSPLAQAWEEPSQIEALNMPLDTVLQLLTQRLAISFDLSGLPSESRTMPVTKNLKGLPLRHVLALILDGLNLRAEARGGHTIAILPPEAP